MICEMLADRDKDSGRLMQWKKEMQAEMKLTSLRKFFAFERGSTVNILRNKVWLLSRVFDIPQQLREAGETHDAR